VGEQDQPRAAEQGAGDAPDPQSCATGLHAERQPAQVQQRRREQETCGIGREAGAGRYLAAMREAVQRGRAPAAIGA
jgi:hypothetical protein